MELSTIMADDTTTQNNALQSSTPGSVAIPRDLDVQSQANLKYWIGKLGGAFVHARASNPTLTGIAINNANTPNALVLQNNDFASGIQWDATGGGFVCSAAGKYLVTLQVSFVMPAGAFSGANSLTSLIYKNGTETTHAAQIPSTGLPGIGVIVSNLLDLAVGDEVTFYAMTDHPQAVNIQTGSNQTFAYIIEA